MSDLNVNKLTNEIKEDLLKQRIIDGLQDENEIDLFELFGILKKKAVLICGLTLLVAIITALYSWFCMPNYYKSDASVLVLKKSELYFQKFAEQLGLSGVAALNDATTGNAAELEAILKSRFMKDIIIDKFGVATNTCILGPKAAKTDTKRYSDLIKAVEQSISVKNDIKSGILSISAETMCPKLSKSIVETYLNELETYIMKPKKDNISFIKEQYEEYKKSMNAAMNELEKFQSKHEMYFMDSYVSNLIKKISDLESMKFTTGIDLHGQTSLLINYENIDSSSRINAMKTVNELKKSEIDKELSASKEILKQMPALTFEYAKLKTNFMTKQQIYNVLAKEKELVELEYQEQMPYRILDEPYAPEVKSKPGRAKIVILAALVAFIIACAGVILKSGILFPSKETTVETAEVKQEA